MARRKLGPQQNPRNIGLNRAASMRGNNRNIGANQPFQGGIGQSSNIAPQVQPPGVQRPGGVQQNNMQCPTGMIPGKGPDGRPTCIPAGGSGQPGLPKRAGGAGIPTGNVNPKNRQGY
tara:strand:- start:1 stop:354 length:354 start_codon:yes stop_codon:yes gene_type:complete